MHSSSSFYRCVARGLYATDWAVGQAEVASSMQGRVVVYRLEEVIHVEANHPDALLRFEPGQQRRQGGVEDTRCGGRLAALADLDCFRNLAHVQYIAHQDGPGPGIGQPPDGLQLAKGAVLELALEMPIVVTGVQTSQTDTLSPLRYI